MSTVKISELAGINLNSNTSNTILVGVDLPTLITGKISATSLAQGLYLNNSLVVGNNAILFPNTVGQFSGDNQSYLQVNLQNFTGNGSSDFVATADNGINANGFINMGVNGSTFNDPEYSAMKSNDGYLYVHGPFDNQPIGNLVIGTATSNAIINFIVGGTTSQNIVGYVSSSGIHSSSIDNAISSNIAVVQGEIISQNARMLIVENVNVTQNVRLSSIETINNNQNTSISIIEGVNLTQNTDITTANNHAWAAFDKANNALANTSGTFEGNLNVNGFITLNTAGGIYQETASPSVMTANTTGVFRIVTNRTISPYVWSFGQSGQTFMPGDVNITGNVLTTGAISLNNSSFASDTSLVKITASDNFVTQAPSNTNYMLHITGKANSVTRVVVDSFGQNTYPLFAGRMGRGSAEAPAAVANNDVMMRIVGNGWTGTQFPSSSPSKIDFTAAENFSDTNRGTRIQFWNTPVGSNTIQEIAEFNAESATFLGTINPAKGFIFTPRVLPGNQTAITIDFSSDVIVKASLTNDLTITFSNYVYGKVVEVWLTNTSGSTRTVTHGCTATNSSENSTTFTMASTSSAYLRYFSIDGDNANTFVAVQSA